VHCAVGVTRGDANGWLRLYVMPVKISDCRPITIDTSQVMSALHTH